MKLDRFEVVMSVTGLLATWTRHKRCGIDMLADAARLDLECQLLFIIVIFAYNLHGL